MRIAGASRQGATALLKVAAIAIVIFNAWAVNLCWAPTSLVDWVGTAGSSAIPAALLIFVMATGKGIIGRILSTTPFVVLGEISYSMYLLHVPIIHYVFVNKAESTPNWLSLTFCAFAILAMSYTVWATIEKPARKAIVGLARKRPLKTAPPPFPA
jgi:peptidoglycan/LPS O-acetylase OafA/YrhL